MQNHCFPRALLAALTLAGCAASSPAPANNRQPAEQNSGSGNSNSSASASNDGGNGSDGNSNSNSDDAASPASGRGGLAVNLTGAWHAAQPGAGQLAGLVLLPGRDDGTRSYFADRIVQCIRAPCPPIREEGTYQVGAGELSLDHAGGARRYEFALRGDTLVLREAGRDAATLVRAQSYCAQPADCSSQPLVSPRCVGAWVCGADSTCGFHCGTGTAAGADAGTSANAGSDGGGVRCGTTTCGAGQYCCNAARSMCARMGMMCIQ